MAVSFLGGSISVLFMACPCYGMEDWLLIQSFYYGLSLESCQHIDATARGAFFSLKVDQAKKLIENMVEN